MAVSKLVQKQNVNDKSKRVLNKNALGRAPKIFIV